VKHGPRTILLKLLTILLSGSPFRWWTRQQLTAGLIPQQSQLKKLMSPARHRFRAISARTAGRVGTNQFQMFATVSIKNSRGDQVISSNQSTDRGERAPAIWFFQDHQWKQRHDPSFKPQASSVKHHAPIFRKIKASGPKLVERQATSVKPQAPSFKLQAASIKVHDL
jgi:hypothetical protein